jgi:TonB family protein
VYKGTRIYENVEEFNLKIALDRNTTIAFCIGTPIVLFLIFLLIFFEDIETEARAVKYNVVPVTILNFGRGDGTGMSKGNLTPEGVAHLGKAPVSNLHDAEIAQTSKTKSVKSDDIDVSSNIKPVAEIGAGKDVGSQSGSSSQDVGTATGSPDGTGLGSTGRGRGLGEGFGDIEWGGGGNRFVISKKPPKFPKGVNTSGTVKIKFRVAKDGTVSSMIPIKKADPALERVAMEALRQWRFNPIDEDIIMEGIIPFTFILR